MIKKIINNVIEFIRFKLSSTNNPIFIGYYRYLYRPKKGTISRFLNEYSLSKINDFSVIQIGANDGITHDPIHKFIKRDKWEGVLLEPQYYIYEQYLKKIYQKNEGIHTLCAAIGEKDGKNQLYKIGFCNMRWATGLASFQKESVETAFSTGHVQANCLKYNIDIPPHSERIISEEVLMISPETLLKKYSISTIDLLQIDVEGYDFEVIRIFNIEKTQPRVIIFENSHLSENDIESCTSHLKENNYAVKKFGGNTLAMLEPLGNFNIYFNDAKSAPNRVDCR
jgi:FkbM family methyltransferase